ncbi:hypothetical protein RCL1_000228 [Eukaryota sp. TZLM3-RCL]
MYFQVGISNCDQTKHWFVPMGNIITCPTLTPTSAFHQDLVFAQLADESDDDFSLEPTKPSTPESKKSIDSVTFKQSNSYQPRFLPAKKVDVPAILL